MLPVAGIGVLVSKLKVASPIAPRSLRVIPAVKFGKVAVVLIVVVTPVMV